MGISMGLNRHKVRGVQAIVRLNISRPWANTARAGHALARAHDLM